MTSKSDPSQHTNAFDDLHKIQQNDVNPFIIGEDMDDLKQSSRKYVWYHLLSILLGIKTRRSTLSIRPTRKPSKTRRVESTIPPPHLQSGVEPRISVSRKWENVKTQPSLTKPRTSSKDERCVLRDTISMRIEGQSRLEVKLKPHSNCSRYQQ